MLENSEIDLAFSNSLVSGFRLAALVRYGSVKFSLREFPTVYIGEEDQTCSDFFSISCDACELYGN